MKMYALTYGFIVAFNRTRLGEEIRFYIDITFSRSLLYVKLYDGDNNTIDTLVYK